MEETRAFVYRAMSEILKTYCHMVNKPTSEAYKEFRRMAKEYFDRDLIIREVRKGDIVDSFVWVKDPGPENRRISRM